MKKAHSRKEQAIVLARVAAAVRLQHHRPKVHDDTKQYDRTKAKRRWQNDQGRFPFVCRAGPSAPRAGPSPKALDSYVHHVHRYFVKRSRNLQGTSITY